MSQVLLCPHCGSPVANTGQYAGWVVVCPRCQQHFQMPGASQPGNPAPAHQPSAPVASFAPRPPNVAVAAALPAPASSPAGPAIETSTRGREERTRRRHMKMQWLAVGATLFGVGLYLVIWLVLFAGPKTARPAVTPPKESREGLTWNVEDLVGYLKTKELDFQAYIYETRRDEKPMVALRFGRQGNLIIYQHESFDIAVRDVRDTLAENPDQAGVAWGRFSFIGDQSAIDLVSAAMK